MSKSCQQAQRAALSAQSRGVGISLGHPLSRPKTAHRLPHIKEKVDTALNAVSLSLETLPEAPSGDPTTVISTLIANYSATFRHSLSGNPNDGSSGFAQQRNAIWRDFKSRLQDSAPRFRPYSKQHVDTAREASGTLAFIFEEDDFIQYYDSASVEESGGILSLNITEVRQLQERSVLFVRQEIFQTASSR